MSDRADRPVQAERAGRSGRPIRAGRAGRFGQPTGTGSAPGPSSSADGARIASGGDRYDAAVAGGGAVGAVLACALADSGSRVLLADPPAAGAPDTPSAAGTHESPASAPDESPTFAPRPIALSLASERALAALGVWEALAEQATPIESIHVSEAGRFGASRLEAAGCGFPRFGSVVAAGALGAALHEAVARRPAIHRAGGRIVDARVCAGAVTSRVSMGSGAGGAARAGGAGDAEGSGETGDAGGFGESDHSSFAFTASLLVVADGGRSELRGALGIGATVHDYRQRAVASVVEARAPREHTAFERFTPDGPVALLPMGGVRYGLVWCCGEDRADRLAGLPERDFAEALDAVLAGRLGGFASAGARGTFPLRLVRARRVVGDRTVLVGNAANHLHPVAGQGFNLGVRDAACLTEAVAESRREGCDPGDASTLERYRRWRAPDHAMVARFTDALVGIFCNRFSPAAPLRAPALVALDLAPPLKRALARRATGLAGMVPRLALGLRP